MSGTEITFAPLLPWPMLGAVAGVAVLMVALALWRGLRGWWLRGLAALALLAALANPALQTELRDTLSDIALVVVDQTASNRLSDRTAQTETARTHLEQELAALPGVETRLVTVEDAARDKGSLLAGALAEALADIPRDRLAGTFLLSDGLAHDADMDLDLPSPLHLLQTGQPEDWDRR